MGCQCDKWTVLKLFEFGFAVACLVCKAVTDDEANRLFLYLQKLSREWSLLNNVTWDRIGSSAADATYGGYVIITFALLVGRCCRELPTSKRITEIILLGVGTVLFAVFGALAFASLDSVPHRLIDNAAVLGCLSLVTAMLFLIDMGGPKAKKTSKHSQTAPRATIVETALPPTLQPEKPATKTDVRFVESSETAKPKKKSKEKATQNGYKKMKDKPQPRRFDIYGRDADEFGEGSETDVDEFKAKESERHSPVWSHVKKGQYGKYDIVAPSYLYPKTQIEEEDRPPSGPGDPGYVQYTAQRWGQPIQKTPRHSPTSV